MFAKKLQLFSVKKQWRLIAICSPVLALLIALSLLAPGWAGAASGGYSVTTYRNDHFRTGQNLNETVLNTSNVNVQQFGKRVSYPVDGNVFAQPLYVPHVLVGGSYHDVVYVATSNDSVYAFDADQTSATAPLWQTSFLHLPVITTVPLTDVFPDYNAPGPVPQFGITGTPVIDPTTGTLYVDAMTKEHGHVYVHRLHALDITTGREKPGSPIAIEGSVPGTGYDSYNGSIDFDAMHENQRTALLLSNGVIYLGWASFGSTDPYHGWLMSYTYDGSGFHQVGIYSTTADSRQGGVWMGASGPAADQNGNIYITSGNGFFNLAAGGVSAGDTVLKLNPNSLSVSDYFTPSNQACLDNGDLDLGSSGPLLLPNQTGTATPHLLIQTGKEGRPYVINRDYMGGYTPDPNLQCGTAEEGTQHDNVVQELPFGTVGKLLATPAYWQGTASSGQFVYFGGINDTLKAFQLTNGRLSSAPVSQSAETFGYAGAVPSVSSNGSVPGTGIVWISGPASCTTPGCTPGGQNALRAYDATNLSKELYNSEMNPARDRLDSYMKFSAPTIADGKVFVGTQTSLTIYGLLNQ
jgi:hypothetical protein